MSKRHDARFRFTKGELLSAVLLFVSIAVGLALVTREASGEAKPSIGIEQCANLSSTCDTPAEWITGNLGRSKALYFEGQTVPYRSVVSGLMAGETYMVRIEWDTTESGRHALDYLTSFDRTESSADPCATALCSGGSQGLGIAIDPLVTGEGVTQIGGQTFDLWGGNFIAPGSVVSNTGNLCGSSSCTIDANPSAYSHSGDFTGSSTASVEVYFTATDTTAVLAWGGHIASRLDWGAGSSAADLPGSPYHMRLIDFRCSDVSNCSTGQMDLSLSSNAIVFPGSITIVKEASTTGSTPFAFTASPAPLENFSLVDDGSGANSRTFTGVTAMQEYVVEEVGTPGWDLDGLTCDLVVDRGGSYTVDGSSVNITLAEGDVIVCTFANSPANETSTTTTTTTSTTTPGSTTSTTTPGSTTSTTATSTTTPASATNRPDRPSRPASTSSAPPLLPSETPTTTEPTLIQPAEVPSDSLPSTGSTTGTVVGIGVLLIALGLLGLTLLAVRTAITKGPRS
jgi:hypothetical protein